MIYSPTHGFVFLKTRKTAGTSIEMELTRHMDDRAVITPIYPEEAERVRLAGRGAQNYQERRSATFRVVTSALRHRRWPTETRFWNHMTAAEVRDRIGLQAWNDAVKIAIVRNPWDVVASRFHMEQRRRDDIRTVDDMLKVIGIQSNWPI